MDLVGAWLRQLLRAGTAAALVPVAIVAALVVVVIGAGGLGGLGSLGQLVSGPAVSPAERDAAGAPAGGRDVAPVSPALASESERRRAPSAAAGTRRAPVTPAEPGTPGPTQPQGPSGAIDPGQPPTGRPGRTRDLPEPGIPGPQQGAPRPPTTKERAQVLGEKLHETVGEVGTVVQVIVDGLAKTLGRIAPPPPAPPPPP